MIIDLAIASVLGMRTDRFMDIDIVMAMIIRSKTVPQIELDQLGPKSFKTIDLRVVQHGPKGFMTAS